MDSKTIRRFSRLVLLAGATLLLLAAESFAQGIDIPAIMTSGKGPDTFFSTNYIHQFAADVDDANHPNAASTDGEMSRDSWLTTGGHRFQLSDDVYFLTQGSYGLNAYHFDRKAGAYRWEDTHMMTVVGLAGWKIDDNWSMVGGGIFRLFAEGGADFGEAATGGGILGFDYTWSDTLQTGLIIGVMSRIEDSVGLIPLPTVHWQFADDWTFNFGLVNMAHPGIGPELIWRANEKIPVALAGSFQSRRYRLDDRNDRSSKGVGEETSFPIFLRVGYKPTEMSGIHLLAGVTTGGNLRVEDDDGHKIKEDNYATAGFLGLRFNYMF
jgi:hypothetical protein